MYCGQEKVFHLFLSISPQLLASFFSMSVIIALADDMHVYNSIATILLLLLSICL